MLCLLVHKHYSYYCTNVSLLFTMFGYNNRASAGMSSLLAAAAAESFQYSDGRPDQPNSSSAGSTQLGKGGKKSGGKPRSRAYNGVVSNNGLPFMHSSSGGAGSGEMEVAALEGGGEYSNLSFETGSSGNSQSGSGLGSRHTAPVPTLPSYSTPAMVSERLLLLFCSLVYMYPPQ